MPLSRLTQTLPLDWAAAMSGEEAVPPDIFADVFLTGVGLRAGAALDAGAGAAAGVELAAGVAGAASGALMSDFLLLWLFLDEEVSAVVSEAAG